MRSRRAARSPETDDAGSGSGLGPRRLAEYATRRPGRVLAAWAVVVLVSMVLIGGLLPTAVTSEAELTNNPESSRASDLIDARLPDQNAVDEVIVVRSEDAVVTDPAFEREVRALADAARASGSVREILTYLDPGGEALVSADDHATLLAVVLAEKPDERIEDLIPVVENANGTDGFAVNITGTETLGRDFTQISEDDLSQGELQFGLPAALVVLLLVFGTLTGAVIPMLMAIISIVVALGITAVVGQAFQLNLFITNTGLASDRPPP
jgi:putative drug exporter of the RND superfamily